MRIEQTVQIDRPVDDVWEFIADARNDPRWCDKVESVEQVAGKGPGSQARYRALHRPIRLKKPKELAVTIEEYEPPRRLRLREEDGDAVFHVTYELEEARDGTSLTQKDEIEWKIPLPARPIGGVMVSRDVRRQFAALKRLLEAS
jgi:uncharacterized protein YndB with AHSA1/START domain